MDYLLWLTICDIFLKFLQQTCMYSQHQVVGICVKQIISFLSHDFNGWIICNTLDMNHFKGIILSICHVNHVFTIMSEIVWKSYDVSSSFGLKSINFHWISKFSEHTYFRGTLYLKYLQYGWEGNIASKQNSIENRS